VLRAENCTEDTEVSILLADDECITILNGQYRGIDAPTDVLAFSQHETSVSGWDLESQPNTDENPLGDVVISVETALRQAQGAQGSEREADLDSEIDVLLAHGLLHLLGYDHAEPAEAEKMFARQAELVGERRAES
jgi:probable rRNA maturation factor